MGILLENFQNALEELTYAEQNALAQLDSRPDLLLELNLTELALRLNSSNSTLIRLSQKLGFDGFSEFKHEYKHLIQKTTYTRYSTLLNNYHSYFQKFLDDLNFQKMDYFVEKIKNSSNLWIISGGLTKPLGEYMSKKLYQLDRTSIYVYEDHMFSLLPNLVKRDDLVIFVSASGDTEILLDCARKVKYAGTPILTISNNPRGALNRLSIMSLCSDFPPNYYHNFDITSRLFLMGIIDLILDIYLNKYLKNA